MAMKHRCPRRANERASVAACRVDRYLTRELHKLPGFEAVSISAGYRLRAPDESGCNWSGDVVPMCEVGAPLADIIASALPPIVKAAKARFNLGE